MESFNNDLPKIVGSLLNCFCKVLEVLPDITLDRLPRMADFARLCQALTQVYGWEPGLLDTYYNNRSVSFEEMLETSPAAMAVVKLVQRDGIFEGTIKSLFEAIQPMSTQNWVKTYRGLADKLLLDKKPADVRLGPEHGEELFADQRRVDLLGRAISREIDLLIPGGGNLAESVEISHPVVDVGVVV